MRRNDALAASLGAALAALLASSVAGAYCRTSSCDPDGAPHTGAVCVPPRPDDCGLPIAWPQPCVEYSVQQDASTKITLDQTKAVMQTAFATWMNAACPGGGHPSMAVSEGADAVCAQHEYNQNAGNANIILYHDDVWPYEGSSDTLALTTVTYNLDTGDIYDADMELNTADVHFTVGDTNVDFDLLSVVTHESGHFLGMGHSHDPTAVMFPVYNEHTTSQRHLAPDDIAGICSIYPPGKSTDGCDPTPRHGFSPLCAADQPPADSGGCHCSFVGFGRAPGMGTALATLGAVFFWGARRRRRSAR